MGVPLDFEDEEQFAIALAEGMIGLVAKLNVKVTALENQLEVTRANTEQVAKLERENKQLAQQYERVVQENKALQDQVNTAILRKKRWNLEELKRAVAMVDNGQAT